MRFSHRVLLFVSLLPASVHSGVAFAQTHHTIRFVYDSGSAKAIRCMTFSPDGKTLAISTSGSRVTFVRVKDGEIVKEYQASPFSMGYSQDGSRIFMVSEQRFLLLDTKRLTPLKFDNTWEPGFVGILLEKRNGKILIESLSAGGPVEKLETIRAGDELVGVGQGKAGNIRSVIGKSVQ